MVADKRSVSRLVIVSDTIRRDFQQPLESVHDWEIFHLYRNANYADMTQADFSDHTIQITNNRPLKHLLAELKPDVLQIPEPTAGYSRFTKISWKILSLTIPSILYAKKTNTPVFFHMLENIPLRQKYGLLAGIVMEHILKWCVNACFVVVVLNNAARDILHTVQVPDNKIEYLLWGNWGIDMHEFAPDHAQRSEKPYVLFVGRVSALKGIPELLEAWPHVLKSVPEAELHIVGDGDLAEMCKAAPRTHVHGVIKHREIPTFFRKATVVVAPSVTTRIWAEQVGMVNLQSIACGTPVISTTSGAIPEYVPEESGAILVPEHNSAALSEAIIDVLRSPEKQHTMSTRGIEYAKAHYEAHKNVHRAFNWLSKKLAYSHEK